MLLRFALTAPTRMGVNAGFSTVSKSRLLCVRIENPFGAPKSIVRNYARQPRSSGSFRTAEVSREPTLKERLMAPPSVNAYSIGKGAAAGASAIGLGALCFYGLGMGKEANIYNNSMFWPDHVKQRVHTTYGYLGASCVLTAVTAAGVFRSPRLLKLVSRNGAMAWFGTLSVMIGTGVLAQSIKYKPGLGPKQLAWALHCAVLGGVIAPMCVLGGPILARAAMYTGGIVAGLSTVAVCAPSDKFLLIGGPLAVGFGFVFASSVASLWLPPTTVLGAGLASLSLYGGLILFSGFLLYDTQRVIRKAESHPVMLAAPFDPINASLSLYMDSFNLFVRIVKILAGGGGNRRR